MNKTKAVILVIPEPFGKHFDYLELIHSDRAVLIGVENKPATQEQVDNLSSLVKNVLDPIRDLVSRPVSITSGFRSELINEVIGGSIVPPSQHMKGEAADITFPMKEGESYREFAALIRDTDIPVDQCIVEQRGDDNWIHVSHKRDGKNRKQFLTFTPKEGYRDL